jgi:hypothetical protein
MTNTQETTTTTEDIEQIGEAGLLAFTDPRPATFDEFQESFRTIVRCLQPRGLDRHTAAAYYAVLRRFSCQVMRDTAREICETRKFFPTTSEWAALAGQLQRRRASWRAGESSPTGREDCEWCAGRGVARVGYRDGQPFDLAICGCLNGSFFRKAGPRFLQLYFRLGDEHRIALIEEFDEPTDAVKSPGFYVYAFDFGATLKIGFSTNPSRRLRALSSEVGRDGVVVSFAGLRSRAEAVLLERWLHAQCGRWRLDGEWFTAHPPLLERLRVLLSNPEAVDVELAKANAAQAALARRPSQENARVIAALCKEFVGQAPPAQPIEELATPVLERCSVLGIAADEPIVLRALRAADYRVRTGR